MHLTKFNQFNLDVLLKEVELFSWKTTSHKDHLGEISRSYYEPKLNLFWSSGYGYKNFIFLRKIINLILWRGWPFLRSPDFYFTKFQATFVLWKRIFYEVLKIVLSVKIVKLSFSKI